MHHALQIPEILLNIFDHVFHPPSYRRPWPISDNPDMAALARTCRAFKEPALDILWSVLRDMSPVARCLPDASCQMSPVSLSLLAITGNLSDINPFNRFWSRQYNKTHKFFRPLSQAEWDILRSYTRRIRSIVYFDAGFDWDSVCPQTNCNALVWDLALFPNLRFLTCRFPNKIVCSPPHQRNPSLTSIRITVPVAGGLCFVRDCLQPFSELYPNLMNITLSREPGKFRFHDSRSVFSWPWKDLRTLDCHELSLDAHDIEHLSRLPALTQLTFALIDTYDTIAALNSSASLIFPSLQRLKFSRSSGSLETTSRLLAQIRLPVITDLDLYASDCPSKSVTRFLAAVETACINRSIMRLQLHHRSDRSVVQSWTSYPILTPQDLRPITTLTNIRHVDLNIPCRIGLTDGALLELASAWPYLEFFSVNESTGWNRPDMVFGGITPDGLHKLLQKCPSLNHIALVIDTHGYTTEAAARLPAISRPNATGTFHINVIDSTVEEETVSAMAIFLSRVMSPYDNVEFVAWRAWSCRLYPDHIQAAYQLRWGNVYGFGKTTLGRDMDDAYSCWGAVWETYGDFY